MANDNTPENVIEFRSKSKPKTSDDLSYEDTDPKLVLEHALKMVKENNLRDVIVIGLTGNGETSLDVYMAFGPASRSWVNLLLDYAKHDCLHGEG